MSLFAELKRRNVVRVTIAYVVAAWLLVQVGDIARESFEAPAWVMKMLITTLIAGLPIVVFFSWAFEITPEGIKREKDIDRSQSITTTTGKKLNYVTIALLVLAIAVVGIDRYIPDTQPATTQSKTVSTQPEVQSQAAALTQAEDRNSIAVLPFINMSDDPSQEYFSDGISEELLNLLVKVNGLNVASRTSSFAFKGSTASIPDIASQLKVTNILEGSVRKAGNKVRITAQLIDTTNDRHLWSDTYDRELTDIFAIQDEIANAIVTALTSELGLELDADEVSVEADTRNMDAYQLFLQGRALVIARRDFPKAIQLLERATELDPEFARAWSMLGMAYYLVPSWSMLSAKEDAEYYALTERAIDRALELDPSQSISLAVKAMLKQYAKGGADFESALELISRALELDPANATAWLWRSRPGLPELSPAPVTHHADPRRRRSCNRTLC
jgi:TolB-like protein